MTHHFDLSDLLRYFYVFTRLGGGMMIMPGFGDFYIPVRIRLLITGALTIALGPLVLHHFPLTFSLNSETLLYMMKEILIGFVLGGVARIFLNSLQVTANLISLQTSLSSANVFNPSIGSQDSLFAPYLMMGATTVIFASNTHYHLIEVFLKSYESFPPAGLFPFEGIKELIVHTVSHSFYFGVKLALPFLIGGVVIHFASGLLSRLVPQIQVFFILMPAQILGGLALILLCVVSILSLFQQEFFHLYEHLPGMFLR